MIAASLGSMSIVTADPMRLTSSATAGDAQRAIQGGTFTSGALGDTPRTNYTPNSQWRRTTHGARRAGPGWTNAHAKRVARKARNVRRHRAANR